MSKKPIGRKTKPWLAKSATLASCTFTALLTLLEADATAGELYWRGNDPTEPEAWDETVVNWSATQDGASDQSFVNDGSYEVTFDGKAISNDVDVDAGGVSITDMYVDSADFRFSGGGIAASGFLSAFGTNLTFANDNTFAGGVELEDATLILEDGVTLDAGSGLTFGASAILTSSGSNRIDADTITFGTNSILRFENVDASPSLTLNVGTFTGSVGGQTIDITDVALGDGVYTLVATNQLGSVVTTGTLWVDGFAQTSTRKTDWHGLATDIDAKDLLLVKSDTSGQMTLTWNGTDGANTWNTTATNTNWTGSAKGYNFNFAFKDNDSVIFDGNAAGRDVNVGADGVSITDMDVDSADFRFSGGGITASGLLNIFNANLTFANANANTFAGGVQLLSATLTLEDGVTLDAGSGLTFSGSAILTSSGSNQIDADTITFGTNFTLRFADVNGGGTPSLTLNADTFSGPVGGQTIDITGAAPDDGVHILVATNQAGSVATTGPLRVNGAAQVSTREAAWYGLATDAEQKDLLLVKGDTSGKMDLTWNGDGGANAWNTTATNTNWLGTVEGHDFEFAFKDNDSVVFNDKARAKNVDVDAGGVAIAGMSVDNSVGNDYTFSGGSITATGGLAKDGAGSLRFDNDTAFSGDVAINAGSLRFNKDTAFGGDVDINAGTLVLGGVALDGGGSAFTLAGGATLAATGSNTVTADSLTTDSSSTFAFDLGTAGTTLAITANTLSISDSMIIDLLSLASTSGTHTLITATGHDLTGYQDTLTLTLLGETIVPGTRAGGLSLATTAAGLIQLVQSGDTDNRILTWTGSADSGWNLAGENWTITGSATPSKFLDGDVVNFVGDGAGAVATRAGGVRVAGMFVSGTGDYAFTGGGITALAGNTTLTGVAVNGKLTLGATAASDGSVAVSAFSGTVDFSELAGANDFRNGVDMYSGTLRISAANQLGTTLDKLQILGGNANTPTLKIASGSDVVFNANGADVERLAVNGGKRGIISFEAGTESKTTSLTVSGNYQLPSGNFWGGAADLLGAGTGLQFTGGKYTALSFAGNVIDADDQDIDIHGGGLSVRAGGTVSFSDIASLVFEDNMVQRSGCSAYGGAIYNEGSLTFGGNGSVVFQDNISSYRGGAIYNKNGTLTFDIGEGGSVLFSGNSADAGSSIFLEGGTLNINTAAADALFDQRDAMEADGGTISKTGAGVWKLDKGNKLQGAKVTVGAGTLHLYDDASAESMSEFTLAGGARVESAGGNTLAATTLTLGNGSILSFDLTDAEDSGQVLTLNTAAFSVASGGKFDVNIFEMQDVADPTANLYLARLANAGVFTGTYTDGLPTYRDIAIAGTRYDGFFGTVTDITDIVGYSVLVVRQLKDRDQIPNIVADWGAYSSDTLDYTAYNVHKTDNALKTPEHLSPGDILNLTGLETRYSGTIALGEAVSLAGLYVTGGKGYALTGDYALATTAAGSKFDAATGDSAASGKLVLGQKAIYDSGKAVAEESAFGGTLDLTGLTGTVNFAGGIDIYSGALKISKAEQIAGGDLTLSGGTLLAADTFTLAKKIVVDKGAAVGAVRTSAINVESGETLTLSGAGIVDGAGLGTAVLEKTGAGTLTIGVASAYTGTTAIGGGTLRITHLGGVGSGAVNTGSDATHKGVFEIASSADGTFANTITGSGGVLLSGSGSTTLSGANSHTGGTILEDGTLVLGHTTALGVWDAGDPRTATKGLLLVQGAGDADDRTLSATDDLIIQNHIQIGNSGDTAGGLTVDIAANKTLTISGVETASGNYDLGRGGAINVNVSSADGVAGPLAFSGGGKLVLADNTAEYGGAVGASFTGVGQHAVLDFTGLGALSLTGNTAMNDGGGIYADSQSSSSVTLGANTFISGNTAGGLGGGIFIFAHNASASLAVQGNTYFKDNLAGSVGGAIFLSGSTGSSITLDTGTGAAAAPIAFSGNKSGVDLSNPGNPSGGDLNSIRVTGDTELVLAGDGNIYFDDPIASQSYGNTLVKTGSGIAQFLGENTLNTAGVTGNAVDIQGGTFRLAENASFNTSGGGAFNVASGGTLAGLGTVTASAFTISGTISPDSQRYAIPDFDEDTNIFATASLPTGSAIGTLSLVGDTTLNGATLAVDVATGNQSDLVKVTGMVTFSGTETIELGNWVIGNYEIVTAIGFFGAAPTEADVTLSGGGTLGPREAVDLYLNDSRTALLMDLYNRNLALTWTGATNSTWNGTSGNWTNVPGGTATETVFQSGDRVFFDTVNTGAGKFDITLPGNMTVADMTVTGLGHYIFNGGSIIADADESTLADATGKLNVGTATDSFDGSLTLNQANDFRGGAELRSGTLVLGHEEALGVWAAGDPETATKGLLLVQGSGGASARVLSVTDDLEIQNHIQIGNRNDTTGGLTFDIATGKTLTISGVENTSSNPDLGKGGAINVNVSSADGVAGPLAFIGGGMLVLADNTAEYGGAVGVYFDGFDRHAVLDFTDLGALSLTGNRARYGGGIYASSLSSSSVTLDANTLISGNTAGGYGGGVAIYTPNSPASLTVKGNTYFKDNLAGSAGGAIYLDGSSGSSITLDTGTGPDAAPIAFSGNKSGVDLSDPDHPTGGDLNSIYVVGYTKLVLAGDGNIYFDDPITNDIGGNSLVKTGSGIAQFLGENILATSGVTGNAVDIQGGTFRLAENASFDASGSGAFNVASGGTLAGLGTVTARAFTISGTISPDSLRYAIPEYNRTTNIFADALAPTGSAIGTLSLSGNTTLSGATLAIDLATGDKSDLVKVTGTVAFSGTETIELSDWLAGSYTIVTATAFSGTAPTEADVALSGGGTWGPRQAVDLYLNASSTALLMDLYSKNIALTWTGATNNTWNGTFGNWTNVPGDTATETVFQSGDRVLFDTDNTGTGKFDITLPGNMTVADMTVTGGGHYIFGDGSIIADAELSTIADATGKLYVGTSTDSFDGSLTLNQANDFRGGAELRSGTLVLGHEEALGVWAAGDPETATKGLLLVQGAGDADDRVLSVADDLEIQNHIQIGNSGDTAGGLTFDIAAGRTLTISGVKTTSSDFYLRNGGAINVNVSSADGGAGPLAFTGGGKLVLADNTAEYGGAVGASFTGVGQHAVLDFTGLGALSITGNAAMNDGGGIYAFSQSSSSVTLGANTFISGNTAGGLSGGIFIFANNASASLAVQGNTYFKDNLAGSAGGAIILTGSGSRLITLDTGTGAAPIAFSGNKSGVDLSDPDHPTGGDLNSINFTRNTKLVLAGDGNIYFDDPITSEAAGNTLVKTGSGIAQFLGENILRTDGVTGNAVDIQGGTFRLAENASFDASGSGAFNIASGGTLAGLGTVTARAFTISGTISPDSQRYAIPYFDTDTNTFADALAPTGSAIGTLSLSGNTTLNGATLAIDLATGDKSDLVKVTGTVAFSGTETIELGNWVVGNYEIVTASGFSGAAPTEADVTLSGGGTLGPRQAVDLYLNASSTALMMDLYSKNIALTWTGAVNSTWNGTSGNWTNVPGGTATETVFQSGDRVFFDTDNTGAGKFDITLPGNMTVADMTVTGDGGYIFGGGSIIADADLSTLADATGKLYVGTATDSFGGSLTLNQANDFRGGAELRSGTLVLGHEEALGVWAAGDPRTATKGLLLVQGAGDASSRVLSVADNLEIQNHIQIGNSGDTAGGLTFDIATGRTLTISGVETTSSDMYLENGGAINVNVSSTDGVAGPLAFTGGGKLVLAGNTAEYGGAVGAYFTGVGQHAVLDFTGLGALSVIGNTSLYFGGGMFITANSESASLAVQGNTYFKDNLAGSSGGAIYLYGSTGSSITLDTGLAAAPIAFSGNKHDVDLSDLDNPSGGVANSIYVWGNTELVLAGDGNIYFDDPIASRYPGNTLVKTGSGIAQFLGENTLDTNGVTGNAVDIQGGTFRLAENASFDASGGGAFNVASGATLAGLGTVTASAFAISGTISPDSLRYAIPEYNRTTNTFADAPEPEGDDIGRLSLVGDTTLGGATLELDLGADNVSDLIAITGGVAAGADGTTLRFTSLGAGSFTILTASDGGIDTGDFVIDRSNFGRRADATLDRNSTANALVVDMILANLDLLWNGAPGASTWNEGDQDNRIWLDGATDEAFIYGDYVLFADNGASTDVTVDADGVTASGMRVSGADYVFTGGKISAVAAASGGLVADPTGRLDIESGASATFHNKIAFAKGIDNAGVLRFNPDEAYELASAISGAGGVFVDGGARLTLAGANDATGTFTQSAGEVEVKLGWAGDFLQTGGKLATAAGATLERDATFSGQVDPSGTLAIGGDLTLNGATLFFTPGTDLIDVAGAVNAGAAKSTADVASFVSGERMLLITSGDFAGGADDFNPARINGGTLGLRQTSLFEVEDDDLYLTIVSGNNLALLWTGGDNGKWKTTGSWNVVGSSPTATDTFNIQDYVVFDAGSTVREVEVAETANVSGMEVNGGQYVFSGEKIVGARNVTGEAVTPTGRLAIAGNGTSATFQNDLSFSDGIDVGAGASLTLERATAFTLDSAVSGAGEVIKTGSALLTLSGANTADGMLTHREGGLTLASDWLGGVTQESGAGVFTAESGIGITADASFAGTVDLNGTLTAGGGLTLNEGAELLLNTTENDAIRADAVLLSGTTTVNLATLHSGTYTFLIAAGGAVSGFDADNSFATLYDGRELSNRQSVAYSLSVGGDAVDMSIVVKNMTVTWGGGNGAWSDAKWLEPDDNRYIDGDTVVFGDYEPGLINVGGTVRPASVTVTDGADYAFRNGTVIAAGVFVVQDGATLSLDLPSAKLEADSITFDGDVKLTGHKGRETKTYDAVLTAANPLDVDRMEELFNIAAVLRKQTAIFNAADTVMGVEVSSRTIGEFVEDTPIDFDAKDIADSLDEAFEKDKLPELEDKIYELETEKEVIDALDYLRGRSLISGATLAKSMAKLPMENPLWNWHGLYGDDDEEVVSRSVAVQEAYASLLGADADNWRFHAEGLGSWGRYHGGTGESSYDERVFGGMVAADRRLSEGFRLGAALASSHGRLTSDRFAARTSGNSFAGLAYMQFRRGSWFLSGVAQYGGADMKSRRSDKANLGLSNTAEYWAHWSGAGLAAGRRLDFGAWTFLPAAGATYMNIRMPNITEKGVGGLRQERGTWESLEFEARLEASRSFRRGGAWTWSPKVMAGVAVEALDTDFGTRVGFAGEPTVPTFRSRTTDVGRAALRTSIGLEAAWRDHLRFHVRYQGDFRRHQQNHTGRVGVELAF